MRRRMGLSLGWAALATVGMGSGGGGEGGGVMDNAAESFGVRMRLGRGRSSSGLMARRGLVVWEALLSDPVAGWVGRTPAGIGRSVMMPRSFRRSRVRCWIRSMRSRRRSLSSSFRRSAARSRRARARSSFR